MFVREVSKLNLKTKKQSEHMQDYDSKLGLDSLLSGNETVKM